MSSKKVKTYYYGTGRRKTSVARVRLFHGTGDSIVNDKPYSEATDMIRPLALTGFSNKFHFNAKTNGGGKISQVEAVSHGIARALVEYDKELRSTLKKAGFLKRDPREKERKKPGLKKARRAPQWSKR